MDARLEGADSLLALRSLQDLSLILHGEAAAVFSRHTPENPAVAWAPRRLRRVHLDMHSVFDCTDCLEGLQLTSEVKSLRVTLLNDASQTPHEVHWAIKPDSLLARATSLQELRLTCTSMLIRVLPPALTSLSVCARAISVSRQLEAALTRLSQCELDGRVTWLSP